MSLEGAIAANRFGLGARPGEIAAATVSPKEWLLRQLESGADQPRPLDGEPFKSSGEIAEEIRDDREENRDEKADRKNHAMAQDSMSAPATGKVKTMSAGRRLRKDVYDQEMTARFALGFSTQKPFAENLVWFWSNHFAVSSQAKPAMPFVGSFEREAIRPHIAGKFEDMVLASTRHPAMLIYLNNNRSMGPDSAAGERKGKGLNENLGRELMELHTLGVDGGYTQADVIAMAKLLTGWSVDKQGGEGFRFFPGKHEPGSVVLRGKTYSGGEDAGVAAIKDLARDPATARHIAKKFAAHFIADDPPAESVARLEKSFMSTGGDLKALAETLVNDPNAWSSHGSKMRTPVEYVTAGNRLIGWSGDNGTQLRATMAAVRLMGEYPLAPPSPKGWPDDVDAWSGPDALLNRIEWAREFGNGAAQGRSDAVAAAADGFGPLLREKTRSAMNACPTAGEALALLVSSPEFQRR